MVPSWIRAFAVLALGLLSGCEIPPVDPTFISSVPADARVMSLAERAVQACIPVADPDRVIRNFQKAGFGVSRTTYTDRRGRTGERVTVTPPGSSVSVLYHDDECIVGVEGMTPEQSQRLAEIWVRAYGAKPNADFGDGLSDHVSGAWRLFRTEPPRIPDKAGYVHRVYIAAYKTWPQGPYDPQSGVPFDISGLFPDRPGAAVTLRHVLICKPQVSTGPRSGVFLPCSEPSFGPR